MIFNAPQEFLSHLNASCNTYRLMGIDLGARKIGLAFYDSSTKVTLPLRVYQANEFEKIKTLLKEHMIDGLVVGAPADERGVISEDSRKFIELYLGKINTLNLPVVLINERFTSKLANKMLKEIGMSRRRRDKLDDAVAAQLIIDTLLTYEANS